MSLHPDTHQLIKQVEDLSGRMVHVTEDPDLKVMATIITARGTAPAHFLRYRPSTHAVDYLVAYQLGFLVRLFSCPADERVEVVASPVESQVGIEVMGLSERPSPKIHIKFHSRGVFRASFVVHRIRGIPIDRSLN